MHVVQARWADQVLSSYNQIYLEASQYPQSWVLMLHSHLLIIILKGALRDEYNQSQVAHLVSSQQKTIDIPDSSTRVHKDISEKQIDFQQGLKQPCI